MEFFIIPLIEAHFFPSLVRKFVLIVITLCQALMLLEDILGGSGVLSAVEKSVGKKSLAEIFVQLWGSKDFINGKCHHPESESLEAIVSTSEEACLGSGNKGVEGWVDNAKEHFPVDSKFDKLWAVE